MKLSRNFRQVRNNWRRLQGVPFLGGPPCPLCIDVIKINQVWCCSRSMSSRVPLKKHIGEEAKIQKYASVCLPLVDNTQLVSIKKKEKKRDMYIDTYIFMCLSFVLTNCKRKTTATKSSSGDRNEMKFKNQRRLEVPRLNLSIVFENCMKDDTA